MIWFGSVRYFWVLKRVKWIGVWKGEIWKSVFSVEEYYIIICRKGAVLRCSVVMYDRVCRELWEFDLI